MAFSQTEALNILKAESIDEVEDCYEQSIFEFKQKYLQKVPPILLMKSQIKKIKRVESAYGVFHSSKNNIINLDLEIDCNDQVVVFLEAYQLCLSKIRLAISQSYYGFDLINLIESLIGLEEKVISYFSVFSNRVEYMNMESVKLSEDINMYEVQVELKERELKDSEILDYLRKLIKASSEKIKSPLLRLVLKVKKMNQ